MRQKGRQTGIFLGLLVLLGGLVVANINAGTVPISVKEILKILFFKEGDEVAFNIIWKIRLPRIVAGMVLGGGLALSGFLLQTFFGNPIAGPFVLGISAGSKLFVALTLIGLLGYTGHVSSWALVGASFFGALLVMGLVLVAARTIKEMSMLLVAGIMVSYICSAITEFLITFADDTDVVNLHTWSQGSFSGMAWGDVSLATGIVLTASAAVFCLAKPIGAYQMGEMYALSMGVNIRRFRTLLILLSSLLSATVTAFAGPISFVGIAVPHMMKRIMGSAKPLVIVPASFLGGAVFCLFCDLLARTAFAPVELSISTVTALFGAPVVIAMMFKRGKKSWKTSM